MIMTNKILAVALIAALVGGSLGAIVMHSRDSSNVAATTPNSDATYSTDGYRNAALNGLVIALALVAVMVRVKNPLHLADAQVAQMVQDLARPEVDQDTIRAFADYVDGARVLETIQVFCQSLRFTPRRE